MFWGDQDVLYSARYPRTCGGNPCWHEAPSHLKTGSDIAQSWFSVSLGLRIWTCPSHEVKLRSLRRRVYSWCKGAIPAGPLPLFESGWFLNNRINRSPEVFKDAGACQRWNSAKMLVIDEARALLCAPQRSMVALRA